MTVDIASLALRVDTLEVDAGIRRLDRLGDAGDRTEGRIGRASSRMSTSLKAVGAAAAAATAAFLAAKPAFDAFLEFSSALDELSTLIDTSTNDLAQMEEQAKSLAVQFGIKATDQVKGFYQAISAGAGNAAEATEILFVANKLATGGITDLTTSVDILTTVLNVYGDEAGSAEDISDSLFTAMKAGKTTIGELASSLGNVVPIAKAAGLSFDEVAGTVAALTKGGISTSEAVTGLRSILTSVVNPTSKATEAAKELNKELGGLDFTLENLDTIGFPAFLNELRDAADGSAVALAELFPNVRALIPILALTSEIGDEFNLVMEDMAVKLGATNDASEKMASGSAAKVDALFASIDVAAIELGSALSVVLIPAIDFLAAGLNKLFGAEKELLTVETAFRELEISLSFAGSLEEKRAIQAKIDAVEKVSKALEDSVELQAKMTEELDKDEKKKAEIAKREAARLKAMRELRASPRFQFIENLKKQQKELGLTGIALQRFRAAELGASAEAKPMIDFIEKSEIALRDEAEAARLLESDLQKVEQMTLKVITADEKLIADTEEINRLFNLPNGITEETKSRALKALQGDLQDIQGDLQDTEDEARSVFGDIDQFAVQAARNIQSSLANFLFDPFDDGLKGMLDGFINVLKKMAAEIASSSILRGFASLLRGESFLAGASSAFGSTGGASGGSSTGFDLVNTGLDLAGLFSTSSVGSFISSVGEGIGLASVSSFGKGFSGAASSGTFGPGGTAFLGGEGTAIGGTAATEFGAAATAGAEAASLASALGPALAGIGIGAFSGGFIAGDKGFGKFSGQNAALAGAVTGAAIGSVVPVVGTFVGGIIGGVVGGLSAALFGRGPLKQKETNLIGDFGADGFAGVTSIKFKAKGGTFRSSKVDRIITDTDSGELLSRFEELVEGGLSASLDPAVEFAREQALALGAFLDSSVQKISSSLRDTADDLLLGSDAIDNFSSHINIASKKGEALSEKQIGEAIADVADQMALALVPAAAQLSINGERAFETVQRLGKELNVLTNAATITGLSLDAARKILEKSSFASRSEFIDAAGGLDKFAADVNFFGENFLTNAERLAPKSEKLIEDLEKLGLSSDLTAVEFRDLVRSFGEVDGASEELFLGLLDLAPSFVAIRTAEAELNNTTAGLIDSTNNLEESESRILDLRSQLVDVLASEESELNKTIAGFSNLAENLLDASDSLALSSLSPLTPGQKLNEARDKFLSTRNLALSGNQDALSKLPDVGNNFLKASQVFNASSSAFVSDFDLVNQTLKDGAEIAITERDIAQFQLDETKNIVDSVVDSTKEIITIQSLIRDLGSAVLLGAGNPDVSDQTIQDIFAAGQAGIFTPDQILQAAIKNDVSRDQILGATGIDITEFASNSETINRLTGGQGIDDQVIIDAINNPDNAPFDLVKAAVDNGLTLGRIADLIGSSINDVGAAIDGNISSSEKLAIQNSIGQTAISDQAIQGLLFSGLPANEIRQGLIDNGVTGERARGVAGLGRDEFDLLLRDNNLAQFETGIDFVPRTGIALLHKGEAVGPSSMVDELRELRKETARLRKELITLRKEQAEQTNAIIETNVIAIKQSASLINGQSADNVNTAAWQQNNQASIK